MRSNSEIVQVFRSPAGSRVGVDELVSEVGEYYALGLEVPEGATIVDVGANIGVFAGTAIRRANGKARVLCFEPSPPTYAALEQNLAADPLLKANGAKAFRVGLTSPAHAGQTLSFYNFKNFPTNSSFDLEGKLREFQIFFEDRGRRTRAAMRRWLGVFGDAIGAVFEKFMHFWPQTKLGSWLILRVMGLEVVEAELKTLSEFIVAENVERLDILKIDVEGPELHVLEGLADEHWPLVQQVVLETHNRDGRQDAITALLKKNGITEIKVEEQKTVDNGLESVMLLARRP